MKGGQLCSGEIRPLIYDYSSTPTPIECHRLCHTYRTFWYRNSSKFPDTLAILEIRKCMVYSEFQCDDMTEKQVIVSNNNTGINECIECFPRNYCNKLLIFKYCIVLILYTYMLLYYKVCKCVILVIQSVWNF